MTLDEPIIDLSFPLNRCSAAAWLLDFPRHPQHHHHDAFNFEEKELCFPSLLRLYLLVSTLSKVLFVFVALSRASRHDYESWGKREEQSGAKQPSRSPSDPGLPRLSAPWSYNHSGVKRQTQILFSFRIFDFRSSPCLAQHCPGFFLFLGILT